MIPQYEIQNVTADYIRVSGIMKQCGRHNSIYVVILNLTSSEYPAMSIYMHIYRSMESTIAATVRALFPDLREWEPAIVFCDNKIV